MDAPKHVGVAISDKGTQHIPTLKVAALNLKTVLNHKLNINEVASASVVYCRQAQVIFARLIEK